MLVPCLTIQFAVEARTRIIGIRAIINAGLPVAIPRAGFGAVCGLHMADTGTAVRVRRRLQEGILLRGVDDKPVDTGSNTSCDRKADDEQYEPGKRRSSG